jgi:hypothetical protein
VAVVSVNKQQTATKEQQTAGALRRMRDGVDNQQFERPVLAVCCYLFAFYFFKQREERNAKLLLHSNSDDDCGADLWLLRSFGEQAEGHGRQCTAGIKHAQIIGTETLTISTQNSKVEFVASKVTRSHNGSFKQFSGQIDLDPNNIPAVE